MKFVKILAFLIMLVGCEKNKVGSKESPQQAFERHQKQGIIYDEPKDFEPEFISQKPKGKTGIIIGPFIFFD